MSSADPVQTRFCGCACHTFPGVKHMAPCCANTGWLTPTNGLDYLRAELARLIAEVEPLRAQWRNGLCGEEDVLRYERDGARAEVERLTQQRDSAIGKAALLFEQNAEALRLASQRLAPVLADGADAWTDSANDLDALRRIARILGAFPDDETEQQNG